MLNPMASKLKSAPSPVASAAVSNDLREATFDVFRRWGFLQTTLDPLGQYLAGEAFPVAVAEGQDALEARGFYCGTIAAEFMHIASVEKRQWIQSQMERTPEVDGKRQTAVLTDLIKADVHPP